MGALDNHSKTHVRKSKVHKNFLSSKGKIKETTNAVIYFLEVKWTILVDLKWRVSEKNPLKREFLFQF